jgi:hypothetical protein
MGEGLLYSKSSGGLIYYGGKVYSMTPQRYVVLNFTFYACMKEVLIFTVDFLNNVIILTNKYGIKSVVMVSDKCCLKEIITVTKLLLEGRLFIVA